MKAYLHIHNTWEFCHKDVMAEIEIDNRPMVGDFFWMSEDVQEELEKKIVAYVDSAKSECQRDAYGERNTWRPFGVCLDDCIHIFNILWKRHDDGKYYMHIELHSIRKEEEEDE